MTELTTQNLHSHKINDRKSIVQNFKTVVQSQVELYSYKVEKLDASIRLLFANLVMCLDSYSQATIIGQLINSVVLNRGIARLKHTWAAKHQLTLPYHQHSSQYKNGSKLK